MLDVSDYLLSVLALALVLGPLVLAAVRVRGSLLAGWSGMPAYLTDAVLTLALLILISELIGAVGLLQRVPLIVASLAVGIGLRLAVPAPAPGVEQGPPAPPSGTWARRAA